MKLNAFPKNVRLSLARDIRRVRAGEKFSVYPFLVYRCSNQAGFARLVVSLTRRVGNSVRRNYLKRRIREFFRSHKQKLGTFDYLFYASRPVGPGKIEWERVFNKVLQWKT